MMNERHLVFNSSFRIPHSSLLTYALPHGRASASFTFAEPAWRRWGLKVRGSCSTRWHRLGRRTPEMFSNLIESGSHTADLKRKGRFLLGTTLFYALLLAATGVGSIYA